MMKLMGKINVLFFGGSEEVTYKDVATYTGFVVALATMIFVKSIIG